VELSNRHVVVTRGAGGIGRALVRLLILPHQNVAGFMALKGSDPERWLKGMRRILRDARATAAG